MAQPYMDQLKKDSFHWNTVVKVAFLLLKKAMTNVSVLALPDFSKSFIVEIDALSQGLGVVLMQDQRPIAFYNLSTKTKGHSV